MEWFNNSKPKLPRFDLIFKRIFLVVFAASVVGCATQPVSNAEAISVSASGIIDSKYLHPAADTGQVTIKRDSGAVGAGCSSRIFVNAKPVADIWSREKVVLHLPAGEYILSALPNGLCSSGMSEVRAIVKSGAELSFRVGYGNNGENFFISPTAF